MTFKRLCALFACLPIASCYEGKEQALGQCQKEALRVWSNGADTDNPNFRWYITSCMQAHGYFDLKTFDQKRDYRCAIGAQNGARVIREECYESTMERWWRRHVTGPSDF